MNQYLVALVSYLSIGFLFCFLFWLYHDYCVDAFRQRMFSLRDSLFDEAVAGNLDFDSSAYGMLRNTMNGMIRFGHMLGFVHMILSTIAIKKNAPVDPKITFAKRLHGNLSRLDHDQRRIVMRYYREMNIVVVRHLLLSSPLLLITVIVPIVAILAANSWIKKIVKIFKSPIDKLDSLALAEGQPLAR